MTSLLGIRACVFDAYGTLSDFASAAARCEGVAHYRRAALTTLWRDKQLQYSWLRTLQGRYVDFWRVTLGALGGSLGGAPMLKPALRVTFCGALALAVTARVGAVIGRAVRARLSLSAIGST